MLVDVLVLGSIYALLSAGYVIVYRASRVLNFAYPDIFMVAAYLAFAIVSYAKLDPLLMFPVNILLGGVAGALMYALLMAPMAGQPVFAAVLVTVGLGVILRGLVVAGFTGQVIFPGRSIGLDYSLVEIAPFLRMNIAQIVTVLSGFAMVAVLLLVSRYSRLGMQMRATSSDARLAAYRGINIHAIFAISWGAAIALGSFSGALFGLNAQVGTESAFIAVKALVVALVGGMDSLGGVLPAALLVAALETFVQRFVDPQLSEIIPFVFLIAVLLIRPWGLSGTKEIIDRV
ncbi:MAG TPA: branched-chain amino acid ABC transporter permease [Xanthobacteraceae bacterium]|nr:branched-chain amino acid ABC transporter permease [Xanthobacteraceae bacterium]